MMDERPVVFECAGEKLPGILHVAKSGSNVGVVIVVGGPQYRVGSHRQFVLMARAFAASGISVLRFDCRGMGDASGTFRSFEDLSEDIGSAIDCLTTSLGYIERIVLLGLCDAASANLMYVSTGRRPAGLILMNPWVRTAAGEAKAYLKHYYARRLLQTSFWRRVFSREFSVRQSLREMQNMIVTSVRKKEHQLGDEERKHFITRMYLGMSGYRGPILLLISGRDLTASEFVDFCHSSKHWRNTLERENVSIIKLPEADHTFSSASDLEDACTACIRWLRTRLP